MQTIEAKVERSIYFGRMPEDQNSGHLTMEVLDRASKKFDALCAESAKKPIVFGFGYSPGSKCLETVFALAEKIKKAPMPTIAIIYGDIHSAAAFLVMCCSHRVAFENINIVLHPLRVDLEISVARIDSEGRLPKDVLRQIYAMNRRMAQIYRARTKLTRAQIRTIMRFKGHARFNADQALEVGLIDEKIPTQAP